MSRSARLAVVVAALGYFVDLYDLVLFSILRVPSLKSLGVLEGAVTSTGGLLLDLQLGGMLLGGILWGMLGDRRGRLTVLFGSIVMYSLANLGNAWVHDVTWYGVCRVFAGLGLAGELGAGITLVSELLPRERRGLGTTIVASLGLSGAVAAGLIAETLLSRFGDEGWRYAYGLGGVMGLLLLVLRVGVLESGLYAQTAKATVNRGDPRVLSPKPTGGQTIFWAYTGVVAGDVASGLLSQSLGSRKRVLWLFLGALALSTTAVLTLGGRSLGAYYWLMCLLGATTGY
jgi:MFS family permease